MSDHKKCELTVSHTGEVAYLKIPTVTDAERKVVKNLSLHDLTQGYRGPDVVLDFDEARHLIGIEILLE